MLKHFKHQRVPTDQFTNFVIIANILHLESVGTYQMPRIRKKDKLNQPKPFIP